MACTKRKNLNLNFYATVIETKRIPNIRWKVIKLSEPSHVWIKYGVITLRLNLQTKSGSVRERAFVLDVPQWCAVDVVVSDIETRFTTVHPLKAAAAAAAVVVVVQTGSNSDGGGGGGNETVP